MKKLAFVVALVSLVGLSYSFADKDKEKKSCDKKSACCKKGGEKKSCGDSKEEKKAE